MNSKNDSQFYVIIYHLNHHNQPIKQVIHISTRDI